MSSSSLSVLPAPTLHAWTVDHTPNQKLMAEIRFTLGALDAAGADHVTDIWIQELHLINGHPNLKRWTTGALYLMQRDLMQAELANT